MNDLSNENIIHIKKDKVEYIQFRKLLEYKDVVHCFTLKPMDFGMYNNRKEKKAVIEKSYNQLSEEFNFNVEDICRPKQTHTDRVERVKDGDEGIYIKKFDDVDGLTTNIRNKVLLLSFADCTPLLFYDPIKNVISNTHSGWKGTYQRIGEKTIDNMIVEYGCNPQDIICCIGPHIRKCHFEVDKDVRDLFYNEFKNLDNIEEIIKKQIDKEKYNINTSSIIKQTLIKKGLNEKNIIDSKICTVCNNKVCHSFRKEKELSGRSAAIIYLK